MPSSIKKLAKEVKREECKSINNFIKNNSILGKILNRKNEDEDEMFKILSGKGIFPYEFIDNIGKLKYNKELKIQDFYSSLNDANISEEDFSYYLKVWN